MNDTAIQEVQLQISEARELIKRRDQLDRLWKDTDFKAIILDGYFREEAVRLVELKGHPAMQEDKHQNAIIKSIDGIGALKSFFHVVEMQGIEAERALEDAEEMLTDFEEGTSAGEEI